VGTPLFSIITITRDNLAGLRTTVNSVKCQSFRDFEHIVVDGASTDGSADWLAGNVDATWVSEPDRGRYDGMNKGARMATGTYLWFMNAGDVFGDNLVLERAASAIKDSGDPEWLYGLARLMAPDGTLQGVLGFVPFSMFHFAILHRPLAHQATVFKRDFFWSLGGYDEQIGHAADQLLMLVAANESPPLALADFFCDFDATGVTAGRSWWITYRDGYEIFRRCDVSVTRWRALDTFLASCYAILRLLGLSLRAVLRSA